VSGPAVTGVVRDTAGRPVAGATVSVEVEQSTAEHVSDVFKALSSVGILCGIAGGCTEPKTSGYTARDGSFAVPVPRNNPQHDAYSVTVVSARGASARVGASLSLPRSTRRGLRVGAVVVAAGSPRLVRRGGRNQVVAPALPARFRSTAAAAELQVEAGNPPVVDGDPTTVTDGYDPLVMEDEHLLLTTGQTGVEHGRPAIFSSSLDVHGATVPASRGAACYVEGSRGERITQQTCGLTDGVLDTDWRPTDDPRCAVGPCPGRAQHDHRDVTVVLRHPVRGRLLVVRGCTGCSVAVSPDRHHFTTVATQPFGSSSDLLVTPLAGRLVAAVRVQTDTGGFFDSLREVSVFSMRQHG
jgi:hypothetical protein